MPDFEKLAFSGHKNVRVICAAVRGCAIESVVVYSDRAEVKRAVPLTLAPGESEVIVHGLAQCVDKNSIRVEGKGSAVITDVIYSSKKIDEEQQSSPGTKEEYEAVKVEIEQCDVELKHFKFREQVLKKEKVLLAQFANHVSTVHSMEKDDSLSQLLHRENVAAVLTFFEKYEAKVADLDARLSSLAQDRLKVSEQMKVLQANAKKLNPIKKVSSTETIQAIHIGLEAAVETVAVLYLSYVVRNASWNSAYDARVFTKDKTMKVQYYGLIKQQTGEDWENAKISLSTAQPSIGGSAPSLPTRIVRFKRPVPVHYPGQPWALRRSAMVSHNVHVSRSTEDAIAETSSGLVSREIDLVLLEMDTSLDRPRDTGKSRSSSAAKPAKIQLKGLDTAVTKVESRLFNATFAIPRATTIPADNTEHKVTVALVDLSPEFHYNSVPRLSPHSFLQAKAKNTSPYTMLAGPASIFLDSNFVAKSQVSDVSPNEEFTTSLGVDQSLRITCQPVEAVHNSRSGILSKTASTSYTHKFLVKNTKTHSVNIHLSEQVPLSTDDRIKVQVVKPEVHKVGVKCLLPCGHALLNESNNVEWHVMVDPGTELELCLIYTVEHPAEDYVQGLPKH